MQAAAVVVVGVMGLPGAVVAECLSELTEGLSELAVCLLEAAVCPLEALSRSLMGSTVVEVVGEESMEAAPSVGTVGLPGAVYLSELTILEMAVCWLQALVSRLLRLTQSTLVEGLTVILVKVLKVAVSPVSMSAK